MVKAVASLLVLGTLTVQGVYGFLTPKAGAFTPASTIRTHSTMRMAIQKPEPDIIFGKELAIREVDAGSTAPLGFFDPLGFYKDKTVRQKKKLREAELKHGRVAMLAVVGVLVGESFHPLLGTIDVGPATTHFQQVSEAFGDLWVLFVFFASLFEFTTIAKGWDPIEETLDQPKIAGLRDDYVAGDLGFDPLGFCPDEEEPFLVMRTRELNNGRLAMIGIIGMIAQELVTGQPMLGSA